MKAYAQSKGIAIIGVALLFVVLDSADVWADPRIFAVSKESRPEAVTGVPPDYFSKQGQL